MTPKWKISLYPLISTMRIRIVEKLWKMTVCPLLYKIAWWENFEKVHFSPTKHYRKLTVWKLTLWPPTLRFCQLPKVWKFTSPPHLQTMSPCKFVRWTKILHDNYRLRKVTTFNEEHYILLHGYIYNYTGINYLKIKNCVLSLASHLMNPLFS